MNCPTCGKEYTDKDVARDEKGVEEEKPIVTVSKQYRVCLTEAISFYRDAILKNISGSVTKCEQLLECLEKDD